MSSESGESFYLISYLPHYAVLVGFLLITIKILRRNPRNRLNQIFTVLFIYYLIYSLILTASEIASRIPIILDFSFMYLLSFYFLLLLSGLIFSYVYMLYKPEVLSKNYNLLKLNLIYSILSAFIFFIPNGVNMTRFPSGQLSYAKFNALLTCYTLTLLIILFILSMFCAMKVYKAISSPEIGKKFRSILVGIILYFYSAAGITLMNYYNNITYRSIFVITELILIFGMITLYLALGKTLNSNNHGDK